MRITLPDEVLESVRKTLSEVILKPRKPFVKTIQDVENLSIANSYLRKKLQEGKS